MEYLTKDKYAELKDELENLKTVKRKEVAEDLEYSKSLGDLSENAEYHEARDMQAAVEDRISKLELLLQSAKIVDVHHTDSVAIGSKITIKKDAEKEPHVYIIVGSEEADMAQGKLSLTSPMGAALLGKKKGDSVTVTTPKGKVVYTIIALQ